MRGKKLSRTKVILPIVLLILVFVLPAAVHADGRIHVVQRGETLSRIAWRYGTTVNALVRANNLWNPNRIYAGQRLWIPGARQAPKWRRAWWGCKWGCTHVVRPGQTLSQIARRYGTTVKALTNQNALRNPNRILSGQRLCVPCRAQAFRGCPRVHVVKRGQTLSGIARWYGRTTWAVANANGLRNPNRIYVGQRLCIPNWGYCW
ncbi:LysM peptidoglycan-binding domain-containing protein [Chloroflexota bacterium]